MILKRLAATMAILFLAMLAMPAQAADDSSGIWALRAEGRTIGLVTLTREAGGGWRAERAMPEGTTFSMSHVALEVKGPLERQILRGVERPDGVIELRYVQPRLGQSGDVIYFKPIGGGFATWGLKDMPFEPLLLSHARPGEQVAADWRPDRGYALDEPWPSNPEIRRLFEEDQAARKDGSSIDWSVVGPQDKARREAVRRLMDSGALRSGDDFWHAAFIFQHGDTPEDYLLAHSLAIVAAAHGRRDAAWIAAASLDRYLMRIGRKQVYGTQFVTPRGGSTTQEPYDRTTVSDALRIATGVPSLPFQDVQLQEMEARNRPAVPPCARPEVNCRESKAPH